MSGTDFFGKQKSESEEEEENIEEKKPTGIFKKDKKPKEATLKRQVSFSKEVEVKEEKSKKIKKAPLKEEKPKQPEPEKPMSIFKQRMLGLD